MARDFTPTPFGRLREDGPESGQVFREDVLIPALKRHKTVELVLDGLDGLPSSFWEEVMGGIVRHCYSYDELQNRLVLTTNDPEMYVYRRLGWKFAKEAKPQRK